MTTRDARQPRAARRPGRASGLAALAGLLADETRAGFLLALLDGRAWTAGELARHAGVAPSTASEHLGRLVAGGLLTEERQGRHRYVRLADARVAQLVEELAAHAGLTAPQPARTLRESGAGSAMARGRTCYDHLAGRLGIALTDALTGRGLLSQDNGFALTDAGLRWFAGAGIDLDRSGRRPLTRACLDWTERRPHLAGTAGAALCRHALDARWCVRIGSERAVRVTPEGEHRLAQLLGIEATALR
ncbi:ArsR/SmtB family transcription factor [Streptomyces turgidiscabies]|uniref:Transcriptional regulator, ArsR family n=1 Tax=Streptomyces turgidiscabies (strain Car8) TaxID=698760 RepID=L7EWI0_STRT8|nr:MULTISPECIES: winged helix-turn-helix domain-containing protein [Streptomyces]ELP63051.1 transcriptional regulator, ArsR family [Streptomyces turgidiscabies Car8]MDX3493645.1 winged helix-turn-helix domain-containing protein [Streptomyces turgidiscabies]GAQ71761.1 HTH-type transcriptional regulator CmtR [Streptomyces turgidiscabies]